MSDVLLDNINTYIHYIYSETEATKRRGNIEGNSVYIFTDFFFPLFTHKDSRFIKAQRSTKLRIKETRKGGS